MSQIIQPKNMLKTKVGDGGFKTESLAKAQKAIEENVVDFVPIATKYLAQIKKSLNDHAGDKASKQLYSELLDILTQLRAQGSMFHYPSITAVTDTVVDLLDSLKAIDSTIVEIVQVYEKAAMAIVTMNIKSDKDKVCAALVTELKGVCTRYKAKNS
ncbi:MAG: hypothetical protein CMH30_09080 [Micavibrio sp.]|nr:hypothetical protein [Micavibrio sp.]|tara:strand:+ start:1002 stop:1472 length:471 start_codon:yes stop_codon:yes gene_type:complete